jgi:hypothetical protein
VKNIKGPTNLDKSSFFNEQNLSFENSNQYNNNWNYNYNNNGSSYLFGSDYNNNSDRIEFKSEVESNSEREVDDISLINSNFIPKSFFLTNFSENNNNKEKRKTIFNALDEKMKFIESSTKNIISHKNNRRQSSNESLTNYFNYKFNNLVGETLDFHTDRKYFEGGLKKEILFKNNIDEMLIYKKQTIENQKKEEEKEEEENAKRNQKDKDSDKDSGQFEKTDYVSSEKNEKSPCFIDLKEKTIDSLPFDDLQISSFG